MAVWSLDPDVTHLNHGSFGAAPVEVLERQRELRSELEQNPVAFMLRRYQPLLDEERRRLADFLGADAEGLVFVPNATYGVNSVLRSLEPELGPGDEILVTDHGYNACRNAVEVTAARTGASIVVAEVPFPVERSGEIVDGVLAAASERTALVLLDHVTSPTAVVFPVAELVAHFEPDVPVLVDAAHAPGMLDVDLEKIGASFTTANCHKWLCSPKGAAFLHVADRWRDRMHAAVVSHGHNGGWPGSSSAFHGRFDWTGTDDPSARLSVSTALDVMEAHHAEGWDGIRTSNRELVLVGRRIVAGALGVEPPVGESLIGSIAALPLPDRSEAAESIFDPIMQRLHDTWRIEVPVFAWPSSPQRLIRVSAQQYNSIADYERLADALSAEL